MCGFVLLRCASWATVALAVGFNLVVVAAAPVSPVQNLLTLDCNGVAHLFQDSPLELDINLKTVKLAFDTMAADIADRAQCAWYVRMLPGCCPAGGVRALTAACCQPRNSR
jgi:hypothetical protein